MGSLSKAAIVACVVLIGSGAQSSRVGDVDTLLSLKTETIEITSRNRMKHPSSRKTVPGPWPRFAREMLA